VKPIRLAPGSPSLSGGDARYSAPFQARPFGAVVSWVNIELTQNAAEIGYARFLYAARSSQ